MTFSNDRDLLAYEPALFTELPLAGQQRLRATDASVVGTTLSSGSADFDAAAIAAGHVVLLFETPCEVLERIDAHTLTVSRLRGSEEEPAIPPGDAANAEIRIRTFAPQARLVHEDLLRTLGIDRDNPAETLSASSVISLATVRQVEVLGTLALAYAAATVAGEDAPPIHAKATHYQRQFDRARRRAVVLIDTNGDGQPDLHRRPANITLTRD